MKDRQRPPSSCAVSRSLVLKVYFKRYFSFFQETLLLSQRHFSTSQTVSFLWIPPGRLRFWVIVLFGFVSLSSVRLITMCVMLHSEYILELLIIFCLVLILSVLLSVAALLSNQFLRCHFHCVIAKLWFDASVVLLLAPLYAFVIYNFFETDMYFLCIVGKNWLNCLVWYGRNSLFTTLVLWTPKKYFVKLFSMSVKFTIDSLFAYKEIFLIEQ